MVCIDYVTCSGRVAISVLPQSLNLYPQSLHDTLFPRMELNAYSLVKERTVTLSITSI